MRLVLPSQELKMAEQLSFPLGNVSSRQFEPVADARMAASKYQSRQGFGTRESGNLENVQVDPARGFATQRAYKEAQAVPTEASGIRKSYAAMRQETHKQYKFMTGPKKSGGMGLRHEVTDEDPYPTPQAMAEDVKQGRIKTFSTKATGGHEYFSDRDNDKFRAVHDVFGHAAIGRGFSRHGEEAAYLSHRQMYSPQAQQAVASETRGQNSYLNYGATRDNPESSFPNQGPGSKLIGLPKFAQETGKVKNPMPRKSKPSGQGSLF
jgi:hypothetical protein